jgi:hypothetical protein
MTPFRKRRVTLIGLMIILIGLAAGLFLLIGVRASQVANQELARRRPAPTHTAAPGQLSFAKLVGARLNAGDVSPYVTGIDGVHGLGAFQTLFVSSWSERKIYRVDLDTGQKKPLADELGGAHDMIQDGDGSLVTPLYGEDRLVRINTKTGQVTQIAAGLAGPNGIAKARDGGYYVSNAKAGTVVKISRDGKQTRQVATGLKEPAGVLADNDNVLVVAQFADPSNAVIQVKDNGQVQTLASGLEHAESLVRDDERNIIIGHTVAGKAAMSLLPRGKPIQLLLSTNLPGPMVGPVTEGRYLYFESAGGSTVYRIAF